MDHHNNKLALEYDISKIKNRETFEKAIDELEPYGKVMEKNMETGEQELKFVNPKLHFNTGGKVLRALANTRR